jgi:hypothetical protein
MTKLIITLMGVEGYPFPMPVSASRIGNALICWRLVVALFSGAMRR